MQLNLAFVPSGNLLLADGEDEVTMAGQADREGKRTATAERSMVGGRANALRVTEP